MEKFRKAVHDPVAAYQTPFDVLDDDGLVFEQKLALLKSWAWDTQELLVAEDENMKSTDSNAGDLLEDIRQALTQLQDQKNLSDSDE